jgi:hypothetical protein
MSKSLAEALPDAIAKVSEWIGRQEAQAKEMDRVMPGAGDGQRFMANVHLRAEVDWLKAVPVHALQMAVPMPGSKASGMRKRMNGTVERR